MCRSLFVFLSSVSSVVGYGVAIGLVIFNKCFSLIAHILHYCPLFLQLRRVRSVSTDLFSMLFIVVAQPF